MKYAIVILLTIVLISCREKHSYNIVLPPRTASGENTLGFIFGKNKIWSSIEHGILYMCNRPDNVPNARGMIHREKDGLCIVQIGGKMTISFNGAVIDNSLFQITIKTDS